MDFGVFPVFLIILFVVIRVSKELAKLEKGRPGSGDPPDLPSAETDGARDIADFLAEIKRRATTPQGPSSPTFDEKQNLRRRVREAARQRREQAERETRGEVAPPRAASVTPPVKAVVVEPDAYSVSPEAAYDERVRGLTRPGLAHAVFSSPAVDPDALAKRAIVLRDVLGPPVGLR